MKHTWKRWLKSLRRYPHPKASTRRTRPLVGAESLEDRVVPAVTINEVIGNAGWVKSLSSQIKTVYEADVALNRPIPGLSTALKDAYQISTRIDSFLASAQQLANTGNMGNPFAQTDVVSYLNALAADTSQKLRPTNIVLDQMGNTRLRFDLSFSETFTSAPLSLSVLDNPAFESLKINLGAFTVSLSNTIMFATKVVIDQTQAVPFRFVPDTTNFNYTAVATLPEVSRTGNLAGVVALSGSVSASMNAGFGFAFTDGNGAATEVRPLTQLPSSLSTARPSFTAPVFDVTVKATLDPAGPLPEFSYTKPFQYNLGTGVLNDDIAPTILIAGQNPQSEAGRRALVRKVLGEDAAELFAKLDGIIPPKVSEFLTGDLEVYRSGSSAYTINDLTGERAPVDLLQLIGVPTAVIDTVKIILRAQQAVSSFQSNDPSVAEQKADQLDLDYIGKGITTAPGLLKFIGDVTAIFQGRTIDLVKWQYDLVEKQLKPMTDPMSDKFNQNVFAAKQAGFLVFEDSANSTGGTTSYAKFNVAFDSGLILDRVEDRLRPLIGDSGAQFVIDYIRDTVELSFSIDARLQAAVVLGVDTTFLNGGTLGGSAYIAAGPIFDAAFNIKASAAVDILALPSLMLARGLPSVPNPIPPIPPVSVPTLEDVEREAGNLGGTIAEGAQNGAGYVADKAKQAGGAISQGFKDARDLAVGALQNLLSQAGFLKLEIGASGHFMVGVCEPASGNGDGKLSLEEIGNNSLSSLFAARGGLSAFVRGTAQVLGIEGRLSIEAPNIISFSGGCEFPDGTGGPTTDPNRVLPSFQPEPPPFAELNGRVLQVYGTGAADVFGTSRDGGTVFVSRNGRTLSFALADFDTIQFDLRGGILSRVSPGPVPASGGDDRVTIDPVLPGRLQIVVVAGGGNDTVSAKNASNAAFGGLLIVYGGFGEDTLTGGAGTTLLFGEGDDDQLFAWTGPTSMYGGEGDDYLVGPATDPGVPVLATGLMLGGTGVDYLDVGPVSAGTWTLIGGEIRFDGVANAAGSGILIGGSGNDLLIAGDAFFVGGEYVADQSFLGSAVMMGGAGNDRLFGLAGGDLMIGGLVDTDTDAGLDTHFGGAGDDIIIGSNAVTGSALNGAADQFTRGAATIQGGAGRDTLLGGGGNDSISGGDQDDYIDAGRGVNTGAGGAGNDTFIIGRGIDTLFGQGDNDLFQLTNPDGGIYTPGGFITIDGGGETGDFLVMRGGGGGGFLEVYTPGATGSDGLIATTPGVGNLVQSIRFTTLAGIEDTVTVGSYTVAAPGSADVIALVDGQLNVAGATSELRADTFTPVRFNRKGTVTVDAGAGADAITVDNPFPAFGLGTLNIRGGVQDDEIFVTNVDAAVVARVFGDDGDDTITVLNDGGLTIESALTVVGGGGRNTLVITGDPGAAIARETLAVFGPGVGRLVLDRDGGGGAGAGGTVGTDSEQVDFTDIAEVIDVKPLLGNGQLDVFLFGYAEGVTVADGAAFEGTVTTVISGAAPAIRFANKPVVTVNGLGGIDQFTVNNPNPAALLERLELYGNELTGGTLVGDDNSADFLDVRAAAVPLVFDGQGGDDAVRVSSTAGLDDRGNLDGIRGALTLRGGAGTNTLFVSDFTSATANAAARIGVNTITGLAGPTDGVSIGYTGFAELTVRGSNASGDAIAVASPNAVLALTTEGGADAVSVESLAQPADVITGAGDDTVTVANPTHSLAGIQAALAVDGGSGAVDRLIADDSGTAAGQGYTLSDTTLIRTGAANVSYANIDQMTVRGGAGANTYNILATGATTSTVVTDGEGGSLFTITGDALLANNTFRGNGGAEQFVLDAGIGITGTSLRLSGGAGADDLNVNARAGNDVVTIRVTATTGDGTLAGLGLTADFDTLERMDLDGGEGRNSLNWVDDTNQVFGTALAPETGLVVRPLGAASGDVRIGLAKALFPTVAFVNIGGDFTVSGDGDGSGDRDVVSVLAASTPGLQSLWGELVTPNGVDAIAVTDRKVTITNGAAGELRSVALADAGASPTVSTLYVRGGAEARPFGDNVTATPSARVNLLLDGMDPTSGRPGDNLKVSWVGSRSLVKSRDPLKGVEHARFVQDGDGASVGFVRFEKVYDTQIALTGTGPGAEAQVVISDPTTGQPRYAAKTPFPGFFGGVTVASADVTGDGIADVVVGAGNGGGPVVVVYDGIEGFEVTRFAAYEASFRGGVIVSAADVDGDGFADVVTGTGAGGGPRVVVLSGKDRSVLQNYFAYESTFRDGVQVAAGDTNGDGFADVLTGTGRGGAPRVVLFDGVTRAVRADFFAFDSNSRFGVSVGLGDLDGDFIADLIVGDGSATEPRVRAYRGPDAGLLADFMVNDPFAPAAIPVIDRESGVRVGATDLDGDGIADILAGKGRGTRPVVRGYKIATVDPATKSLSVGLSETFRETLFDPNVYGWGIEVGGSD